MLIPPALAAYRQFCLWTITPAGDKVPVDPSGRSIDPHNPANRLTADEATAVLAANPAARLGFVFTAEDPFFFLDIDKALQPNGQWSQLATDMCRYFAGCFIEVSQSGTGLHIIGSGVSPGHRTRCQAHGLELYSHSRFIALTGLHASGDPAHPAQSQLDWLVASYFPATEAARPEEWTGGPCAEWSGPESDEDLVARMLASRSVTGAFSGRAGVADLWNCNVDALANAYPSPSDASQSAYGFDHSSADAALCQHLAFWTGRDCERIDRLFRQSGLYRDKWERTGYMRDTVLHAVSHCRSVYGARQSAEPGKSDPEPNPTEPGCTGLRDGMQLMSVPSQVDYFKGCVYI